MKLILFSIVALSSTGHDPNAVLAYVRSLATSPRQAEATLRPTDALSLSHHEPQGMTFYSNGLASVSFDSVTGGLWAISDMNGWAAPSVSAPRLSEDQLTAIGLRVARLFEEPGWQVVLEPEEWHGPAAYLPDSSLQRGLGKPRPKVNL